MKANTTSTRKSERKPSKIYKQVERAAATEANSKAIVQACVALIRRARRVSDVTLAAIAEEAKLSLRTVLRHFGTREAVFEAAFAEISDIITSHRVPPPAGDLDAAIRSLLAQYELDGDLNIRALEEEHDLPLLKEMMKYGRECQRNWIIQTLMPLLPSLPNAEANAKILELYAATDVYLWKLFRRDLGCSKDRTFLLMRNLVAGVIAGTQLSKGKEQ